MKNRGYIVWRLVPIAVVGAMAILCMGCAAGDANAIKMAFGIEPTPSRQHFENTQGFAREGKYEAERAKENAIAAKDEAETAKVEAAAANSKLDTVLHWIENLIRWGNIVADTIYVGIPTLAGAAASIKAYKVVKRNRLARAGEIDRRKSRGGQAG